MQQSDVISAAKKYMESIHQNDYTGHDIGPVYRVTALALNQSLKMKVLMIL